MSLFMPVTLPVLQEEPAGEGASATLIGISAQGNFPEIRRPEFIPGERPTTKENLA